jgi:tetratricopeptide (TPR) repeat protein
VGRMPDRLRPLWDFEDLDATQARLREQFEQESTDEGRAEVLTQLARVQSLQDEFDACEQLLREAESLAGESELVRLRVELERGRKLRSGGDGAAAAPLFESAFTRARSIGENYLAGDAAHMVAISEPDKMVEWTDRGLELAGSEPEAAYWAGPLLNNLGWYHFDAGNYETALEVFERALEVRKRDPSNPQAIQWAQEAIDETRAAMQR